MVFLFYIVDISFCMPVFIYYLFLFFNSLKKILCRLAVLFISFFTIDLFVDQIVFLICYILCDLLFMKVANLHIYNNYISSKIHVDSVPLIVFKRKLIRLGLSLLTITSLEVFHLTPNQRYKHLKSSQRFCT